MYGWTTHGTTHAGSERTPRSGVFRHHLLAMLVVLVSLTAVARSLPCPAAVPSKPLFVLKPDPPSAGQDLEVVYTGSEPGSVFVKIGNGEWEGVDASGGKFVIPKSKLKPGTMICIVDRTRSDGSKCALIEP